MGIIGPGGGGSGLVERGAWAAGETYALGEIVTEAGSSFISTKKTNKGNKPNVSPEWWTSVGAAGPEGKEGKEGPAGAGLVFSEPLEPKKERASGSETEFSPTKDCLVAIYGTVSGAGAAKIVAEIGGAVVGETGLKGAAATNVIGAVAVIVRKGQKLKLTGTTVEKIFTTHWTLN